MDVVLNKKTQKECKAYFGFPADAKVVAIGYNGRKRQQHMDVLKVLSTIDKSKMENVYLLLHLGYGLESIDYEKKIENYLNDNLKIT